MKFNRASGILLHPTSLPGPYGAGDIGPAAKKWVDFLDTSGCGLWQVLPLGPTGYGDSPYQCFSAFAGNPYLISLDGLIDDQLLQDNDLADIPDFPTSRVDFGKLIPWKISVLDRAYDRFIHSGSIELHDEFEEFRSANHKWLDDYGLFMALKEEFGGGSWVDWPHELRDREPTALLQARDQFTEKINRQIFRQYVFFKQWADLKEYAKEKEVQIIGDIPIFVAHDSADVWANPGLFYLMENGRPSVVAGVPPDYFSETGQLWGNPLYRWEIHKKSNYRWWISRLEAVFSMVDIVRLDHFRGFAGYWEVPGDAKTAVKGRWVEGPGVDFFQAIKKELGSLPIIAEDLGVITPDVEALRDQFDLPGMKILQFAFASDAKDPFLPHNYIQNCIAYTGTHDNDTALGWYKRVVEEEKDNYRRYFDRDGINVAWDLIRGVWSSVAVFGIAPIQDFLDLDNDARMNYPGNPSGNWSWRIHSEALNKQLSDKIKKINSIYDRLKPQTNSVDE